MFFRIIAPFKVTDFTEHFFHIRLLYAPVIRLILLLKIFTLYIYILIKKKSHFLIARWMLQTRHTHCLYETKLVPNLWV